MYTTSDCATDHCIDSMQLLDELSMIYMACTTLYALFSFNQSKPAKLAIGLFLASIAAFITLYYHYLKDPLFHQNMFALLSVIIVSKGIYDMETLLRPYWQSKARKPRLQNKDGTSLSKEDVTEINKRDTETLKTMWLLAGCGISAVGIGFFLWNLDNAFCSTVRGWRQNVGLPWGIFLEGHGWWCVYQHKPE
jgi:dihydroceramidase